MPQQHTHKAERTIGIVPQASQARGTAFAATSDNNEPGQDQWSSQQLLGNRHEIEILHAGSVYRLRVTSLGKLLLTK